MGVLLAVERTRAAFVSASDLYAVATSTDPAIRSRAGGAARDARGHLAAAGRAYAPLRARLRAEDPVLDREVAAALRTIDVEIAKRADLEAVRERLRLLGEQLLDGAVGALLTREARADPGVRAEVASALMTELAGSLDDVGRQAPSRPRRRSGRSTPIARGQPARPLRATPSAAQRAYGLLARSQVILRGIRGSLGPDKDAVLEPLSKVRERAYPLGIASPPAAGGTDRLGALVRGADRTLRRRFGL